MEAFHSALIMSNSLDDFFTKCPTQFRVAFRLGLLATSPEIRARDALREFRSFLDLPGDSSHLNAHEVFNAFLHRLTSPQKTFFVVEVRFNSSHCPHLFRQPILPECISFIAAYYCNPSGAVTPVVATEKWLCSKDRKAVCTICGVQVLANSGGFTLPPVLSIDPGVDGQQSGERSLDLSDTHLFDVPYKLAALVLHLPEHFVCLFRRGDLWVFADSGRYQVLEGALPNPFPASGSLAGSRYSVARLFYARVVVE